MHHLINQNKRAILLILGMSILMIGCSKTDSIEKTKSSNSLFEQENLVAWCIVPFDKLERGPAERVAMLKRLEFSQYAWDWRDHHLKDLAPEIQLAKESNIQLNKIWIWVEEAVSSPGKMGDGNQFVMDAVSNAGISVEYWLGFHENYFENITNTERLEKAAAMISYLQEEAEKSGSKVSLYNHGGWFGESVNQIAIIKKVNHPSVGMVYNFHHAHHEIAAFKENLESMLPYLTSVSINGMNPGGPKIVRLGNGEKEVEMLSILSNSGYTGPIAILGHDENEDVEGVLQENLDGLRKIVSTSNF